MFHDLAVGNGTDINIDAPVLPRYISLNGFGMAPGVGQLGQMVLLFLEEPP